MCKISRNLNFVKKIVKLIKICYFSFIIHYLKQNKKKIIKEYALPENTEILNFLFKA